MKGELIMQNTRRQLVLVIGILVLMLSAPVYSIANQNVELPDGSKIQLPVSCPVCEMKIETNTGVLGALVFANGKVVAFDNISELFRYLLSPDTFGFNPKDLKKAFVLDHDSKKFIEAKDAVYVIGPEMVHMMGKEMEAFSNKVSAEKFMDGAKNKKMLAFSEVSLKDVAPKKNMLKMKH